MTPAIQMLVGMLGLISTLCVAQTRDFGEGMQNLSKPTFLENSNGSLNHWNGIGRLRIGSKVCTATLIDTRDSTPLRRTSAYVLTSGHCIDHSNGKIHTDQPISGTVIFNYFTDENKNKTYKLKRLKWRSMQGVDMAIIELDINMRSLNKRGIFPLKLARLMPPDGSDVLIVGAPQGASLQMAACTLQHANEVVEGKWTWRNNLMTQCKRTINGVSGSPLLDRYTNEIIGVIGTANNNPLLTPCEINAPCMLTSSGYQAIPGNVYGNPVDRIKSCFSKGKMLTKDPEKCPLYPTFNVNLKDEIQQARVIETTLGFEPIPATWNLELSVDTAFYRHKTVHTAKNCETREGYSDPVPATNKIIDSEIGSEPGRYFLCIIGMSERQDFSHGLLNNALSIPIVLTEQ